MIELQIPKFNDKFKFIGYKNVRVKNKLDHKDEMKVIDELPGIPCSYCPALAKIGTTKRPIEITRFYDIRQKGLRKLKNFYIVVL